MQDIAVYGAIFDRRIRKNRIHEQNVLHEREITAVVGNVAKGNECCEEGNCRNECGFAQTSNDHGKPLSKKVAAAASSRPAAYADMLWR
ncbi:hypothetical protein D3C77_725720 [compost metagenome]